MNTLFNQEQIFLQFEQALKVIAAVLVASTPVYALWTLTTMPVIPLV
jgi:hypothetical protein